MNTVTEKSKIKEIAREVAKEEIDNSSIIVTLIRTTNELKKVMDKFDVRLEKFDSKLWYIIAGLGIDIVIRILLKG
jgi:hypothetical protein